MQSFVKIYCKLNHENMGNQSLANVSKESIICKVQCSTFPNESVISNLSETHKSQAVFEVTTGIFGEHQTVRIINNTVYKACIQKLILQSVFRFSLYVCLTNTFGLHHQCISTRCLVFALGQVLVWQIMQNCKCSFAYS